MLAIGDIHLYVSDISLALRFWVDGLRLIVAEKHITPHSAYALLDFPDGGPSLRLIGMVEPWDDASRPATGERPGVSFDITTSEFEETLARLLEHGGRQLDEIEEYESLRIVTVADADGNAFDLVELPPDSAVGD